MIQENDQIRDNKRAALIDLVREYLDVLRCSASSQDCLGTIRRVEAMLNWAAPHPGGGMQDGINAQICEVAYALGNAAGATEIGRAHV